MGPASAPPSPWPFRLAVAGWLAAGVGAWFLADGMARPGQVILAGLWAVGLGLLLRQFLASLVGPVLGYDALRVGRRPRVIILRVAYALLLAIVFGWIYFTWLAFAEHRPGGRVEPKELSRLAELYFAVYMSVQFFVVCLLTPAAVGGAIAEEKERRTLEFLLATDLRDREILFGKLASRVGGIVLFLLAGLPILALMQFFGGIDPDLVLAGFAATVLIVLTLAAISIAASVLSRKARDAIALTYLLGVAYILLSVVIAVLAEAPFLRGESVEVFGYTITAPDAAYPLAAGNPLYMVPMTLFNRARAGGATDLFTPLGHFALFHAVAIGFFVTWAGLRLRPIALRQQFGGGGRSLVGRLLPARGRARPRRARRQRAWARRPDVGDNPVLWKEVFVDMGLRLTGLGRVVVLGLVAASFVPVGFIFWFSIIDPPSYRSWGDWWSAERWDQFGEGMQMYLRMAGTVAATMVFLAIAVRGAGCVTGERDRHTLDVLLTTPLSARTIIWGKWWGCLLGMRWAWAWILALWGVTLAAGGIHPVMFPAAIVSMIVYAGGFAWIGLFCSLYTRTTLRSTMAAIAASVFLGGGYFLLFLLCCVLPLSFARTAGSGGEMDVLVNLFCAFSPSVNLGWLPIRDFNSWETTMSGTEIPYAPFWILGLVGWGLLSFGLSQACVRKFRLMANRVVVGPDRRIPTGRRLPPPLPTGRKRE